ncbi:MAG: type II secretion system secretin GspD [Desulfobacterales bacterium]|nr:type II secretion system secretin GspD [Desulfobacterales bacterium]
MTVDVSRFCPTAARAIIVLFLAALLALPALIPVQAQEAPMPEDEYVSIDFDNVDIKIFVKFISKLTGKNFVVDNRVKGNVTVISPTKISVKEAYQVFESVLEIHGFSTVKSGTVIKIIPSPNAKADNIDTRVVDGPEKAADRMVTRIIPLEYAAADELKGLLAPLLPKGSVILSYRDTNMLIVTATLSSIERLLKIIRTIDVPNIGKKISIIPVRHADAAKLVKTLSSVFTARIKGEKGKADSQLMVHFTADERTNSIILLASKVETQRVGKLIDILDQQVPKGEERIRVYYLEHAIAEDMVTVLQKIPTQTGKNTTQGKKEAPILSQKVHINADKATNSLIIMAEKEDYPVLEDVIKKLDIPRAMVYIECLIMEVNVTRGLNIGTEWQTGKSLSGGDRAIISGFGGTGDSGFSNSAGLEEGNLPKGFSLGVLGKSFSIGGVEFPDIQAVVDAFQSDKDVNILSTPQLLTTENEEAVITVGKNVPYQTRSAAESATETYSSYEYKDVGISLKITPQISKGRLVRLDIFQELTKLDSVNTTVADRPTTLKRQIETTIIVEDSHSVVIGGLIDESITRTENQTPCLGALPGIGWAFKTVNEGEERTNLYVFITPKVVKNPAEATDLYDKKKEEIQSTINKGEVSLYEKIEEFSKKLSGEADEEEALQDKEPEAQPGDDAPGEQP